MHIKEYIKFCKLARNRSKSLKDYFNFEKFQAEMVIKSLKRKNVKIKNMKALDIGCGTGGYSYILNKNGAHVISLDINPGRLFIEKKKFINADTLKLPFKSNSFDIVFCSSLIEHLKEPKGLLIGVRRVLKNGGICYLSFPPFWSPVGSHQFKPFHYLGEKTAIKLSRKIYKVRSFNYANKSGGLYITTIKKVKELIRASKLKIISISTRHFPINFAKIPFFNEFLTWHIEFLLRK